MGSEQFCRFPKFKRRSEGAAADPLEFTVIGVDISAEALISKYKGSKQHGYAESVVRAVVQKYRTAKPPPKAFVDVCRGGIHEPVILCDLGADAKGKSWAVIVEGRQRVLSVRIINAEKSGITLEVPAVFRPFKRETAGLDATLVKVTSNCRVARSFSSRGEDAADLRARGVASIAPLVEAHDETEVELLIALHGCADEVKDAVDALKIPLADVKALAKCSHMDQERMVARKLAGNSKAARNAAAPPRAKTRPAKYIASLCDRIRETMPKGDDEVSDAIRLQREAFLEGLAHAAGGDPPEWLDAVIGEEAAK